MRRAALLLALAAAVACQAKKKKSGSESDEPAAVEAPVDPQWKQVIAWAKPAVEPADTALFERAVGLAEGHVNAVRDARQSAERYAVDKGALPAEVEQAVVALVEWSEAGGGLPVGECGDPTNTVMPTAFTAHEIGRAALLTAPDDPEHPRVRAVLHLARRFQDEGKSVMEVGIGMTLAGAAVDWAEARGVAPGKAFRELAPRADVVFRTVAAESLCQVKLVETGGRDDQTVGTQLASVRAFNSETVHGAFRRKDDAQGLEAYLLARGEQGRNETGTPLLRTLSAANRMYAEIGKERDRYTRFISGRN